MTEEQENQNEPEILELAKKLKTEQEQLLTERAKLDADKKAFYDVMKQTEVSGKTVAGKREPSPQEEIDDSIKKMFEGTGLNPLA